MDDSTFDHQTDNELKDSLYSGVCSSENLSSERSDIMVDSTIDLSSRKRDLSAVIDVASITGKSSATMHVKKAKIAEVLKINDKRPAKVGSAITGWKPCVYLSRKSSKEMLKYICLTLIIVCFYIHRT